jgi:hypothetical protein
MIMLFEMKKFIYLHTLLTLFEATIYYKELKNINIFLPP